GLVEAVVDDPVAEPDLVAADVGLYAADEVQILAEDRRLLHDAFRPEHAAVALPALAIAGEAGGDGADTAMQRVLHSLLRAVDVFVGRHLVHEQDMVE